jgi:NAD(P)-dependent dehydrogenase (short-subunit alcohol dehydrogenase family)
VANWRGAVEEAMRVLRPGGVLLVDFGGGTPGPWDEPAKLALNESGVFHIRPGVSSHADVSDYLGERCAARPLPEVRMTVQRSLAQDLDEWERQLHAWTWPYPSGQMRRACAQVRAWSGSQGWPLDRTVELERVIQWWAFRRTAWQDHAPHTDKRKDMRQNEQKVAVITGASQGIGAEIVAAYRGMGWAVVANARTMNASQEDALLTVEGDISQPETTDRIVTATLERFGRVDTLINDAGIFMSKPFTEYTAKDYASMVGVNLTGFFWLTQRAVAEMVKQGSGHVVNITTTLVDYTSSKEPCVLTSLTKGGLAAATRSLAVEYASRGIRVNAVAPGVIQTPVHPPESYAALGDRLPPMGRVGQISDIVNGILYLESAPFVTGEILHIDGGQIAGH